MARTVKVGVIGTSWWTDLMYLPSFQSHSGAEVVAICGRDEARAKEIAAKFGIPQVFANHRDLIARAGVEAVVISVPDDLHYAMTMDVLDAGLHVLCEKPLANNAVEARAMRDRAVAVGVKHMVLFTWRWQPHWRYLKRLLDQGFIGRCHQARFQFLVPLAGGAYQWRYDSARANGVLGDLGSHMIDFAQWLIDDVAEVFADLQVLNPQAKPDGTATVPANDAAFVTLGLRNGAHAQVHVSAVERLGDQGAKIRVALYGDNGVIEAEHIFFGAEAGVALRGTSGVDSQYRTLAIPIDLSDRLDPADIMSPYKIQSAGPRSFIDAILNDTAAYPDFGVGVKVQNVVDAALRSSATGQRVALG
jgi:predicted dehydrogenase